eukprot:TRINITY_DN14885_c0_g1_i1.p1 TRINITY_DN14885_c0_g1~~TRINITY_DN14885_c0_g1_i1.p1  ORF type:complete len:547 (-),score=86.42 TRINITY_DN14885_c0_g1_i1:9-1586(-)
MPRKQVAAASTANKGKRSRSLSMKNPPDGKRYFCLSCGRDYSCVSGVRHHQKNKPECRPTPELIEASAAAKGASATSTTSASTSVPTTAMPMAGKKRKRKDDDTTTKPKDPSRANGLIKRDKLEKDWSEARKAAWVRRTSHPNAYYYRFCGPDDHQKNGPWTPEEEEIFFKRLREWRARFEGMAMPQWGLFSLNVPGRCGYQCANYYRKLVSQGNISDSLYDISEDGSLKFNFEDRAKARGSEYKPSHGARKPKPPPFTAVPKPLLEIERTGVSFKNDSFQKLHWRAFYYHVGDIVRLDPEVIDKLKPARSSGEIDRLVQTDTERYGRILSISRKPKGKLVMIRLRRVAKTSSACVSDDMRTKGSLSSGNSEVLEMFDWIDTTVDALLEPKTTSYLDAKTLMDDVQCVELPDRVCCRYACEPRTSSLYEYVDPTTGSNRTWAALQKLRKVDMALYKEQKIERKKQRRAVMAKERAEKKINDKREAAPVHCDTRTALSEYEEHRLRQIAENKLILSQLMSVVPTVS